MITINKSKKYLLKENASIKDVTKVLNSQELKICIIVDKKNIPLGIFTDEDIRRLLIKKEYQNLNVKRYLNKKFKFCYSNDNKNNIQQIFSNYPWINILIVIDKKTKKYAGVIHKETIKKDIEIKNEALILAGGLGKRLKPLTNYLPKPMLNFSGRPLLETMLYSLKSSGFKKINISVNYKFNDIIDYFGTGSSYDLEIKYFIEKNRLGTAGPLFFLKKKKLKEPFLVINGDIYTNLDFKKLIHFHKSKKNDITLCCHNYTHKLNYGLIEKKDNLIHEKPSINYLINSGIYIIDPKLLNVFKTPKYVDMDKFVNSMYRKRKKVGIFKIHDEILDIGNFSTYEFAKELIK